MSNKILVIEDEEGIRKVINDFLSAEGFEVILAKDGQEGLDLYEPSIDLILLDIMMPILDGWSVCRRIRKQSDLPIIMLTARGDEDDELMGFELQADDYIKKPFSPAILVARVKKCLQINHADSAPSNSILTLGDLCIDHAARRVSIAMHDIDLTMKCYDILWYLASHEGVVFSRQQILDNIWGYDYFGDTRVVDNHIKKLRKALQEKAYYIRTVFGVGYKLEVQS